ncbi:unnamed protein product [Closterium sp. Naga37s-1]|nr:unnamed protein product [Closterium sp. Naga37s-1]
MSVIPMSPSQPAVSATMTLAAKPVAGTAPLTAKSVSGGASLAADVVGDVWKADWYVAHCYKIPAMAQLNLVLSHVAQAPTRSDISLPSCGPADLKRFHRDLAELISSSEFAGKQLNVFLHAVHSTASGLQKDISKRLANENSSVSKNSRRWFSRFPSGGDDFALAAAALATSNAEAPRRRLDESVLGAALATTAAGVGSAVSGATAGGRESTDVRGHDNGNGNGDGKSNVAASQIDRTSVSARDSTTNAVGNVSSSEATRNLRLWTEANRECLSATFSSGAQPPKSPTKPTFAARLRSRSLSGVTAAVALFRSPENAVPRSAVARGTGEGGAAPGADSGEGVISRERAEAGAVGVTIAGDVARNEVRGSGPFSFRLAPPSALAVGEAEGDEEERGLRGGREAGGAAALRGFLLCGRGMRSDSESGASSSCAEGETGGGEGSLEEGGISSREGRDLEGEGEEGAGRKAAGGIAERERAEKEVGGKRGKEGAERHGVEESNIDDEIQSDTNIFREVGTDSIAFRHDRASVSMPRAATSAEALFPSSTSAAVPATSLERSGGGGVGGRAGDVYGPRLTKSRSVAVERNRHSYSSGSISRGEGGRRGGRGKAEGGGEAGGGGEGGKRAGKPPPKSSHERLQEILKNVTIGGTRGGPLQMARAIARGGVGGNFGGSGPGGAGGGSASAGGMGSPRVWEGMDGQDGISRFHRGMSVAERGERGKGAGGGEGGSGGGARRFMPTSLSVVSRRGGEWGEEEMGEGWAEGEAEQGGEGGSVGASGSSNSQSPHPLLSPTTEFQPPNGAPVSPKRPALSKAKLQQEEMLLQLLRSTTPIRWSLASEGNGGSGGSGGSARMGR